MEKPSSFRGEDKNEGIIASVAINIEIFFCLVAVAIILVLCFFIFPGAQTGLTFTAVVISGVAAVYLAFYAAQSLRAHNRQEIIKNSFEMMMSLSTVEIVKLRHELSSKFDHNRTNKEDFYKSIVSNTEIHTALKTLLNLFDNVSIAIQYGYVDEEIIYESFAFIIPNTYRIFILYIDQTREEAGDARILCDLERLANAWKNNVYLKTGAKITR